ncbi:MAG: zinc ribbon domain-containing protein [Mobilitalea sp.]
MSDERTNIVTLKQERLDLLLMLGEEAHSMIRKNEGTISDNMRALSEQIQKVDVNISRLGSYGGSNSCPQCKSHVAADAAFCVNCGFAVKAYNNQFSGTCNFCGTKITETQNFCDACGTSLRRY